MADPFANMLNPDCACCNPPTPPCAETIVNVWDRMNPGNQATGVEVRISYTQSPLSYNPAFPYTTLYVSGPPGTNFGVLPNFTSYWGYFGGYTVQIWDTINDVWVPWFFNGQQLTVSRCGSLHLAFCRVTIDVETDADYCEAYVPARSTSWGTWVTPHRNVSYSLSYSTSTGPTTPSDPITGRPVTVRVSANKVDTLGNCKDVIVTACGTDYTVALPLYYWPEKYKMGLWSYSPDCFDIGCLLRGPGPEYAGVIAKVLHLTLSPYKYSTVRIENGCDPQEFDEEPSWRPSKNVLGDDWGTTITVTYDPEIDLWDSGWRGGNGRCVFCGYDSYNREIVKPVTATRLYFGNNLINGIGSLCLYQWRADGCSANVYSAILDNTPVDCCPTDIVYTHTVTGAGGGTLTWFTASE